jgi:hypothetical protein
VVLSGIWRLLPEADGSAPSNCTPHFLLSTNVKKQTWVGFFFALPAKTASNNTPGRKKKVRFPFAIKKHHVH